jgi:hypothetical protein
MFLQCCLATQFGLSLKAGHVCGELFSCHAGLFHPFAILYLLKRLPLLQEHFLQQFLKVFTEREGLVLGGDTLFKHLPKFVDVLWFQIPVQGVDLGVFLEKGHVPSQH